jgi:hypothetical protein
MNRPVSIIIEGYPPELVTSSTQRCRWTFTFLDENPALVKKEDFDDVITLLEWAYNSIKTSRVKIIQDDNNIKKEIDQITNNDVKKEN